MSAALLALLPALLPAQDLELPPILPLRERAALVDRWLERRLDSVVPAIMREEGIDLWVVAAREYNEDPAIESMLPATWMAARRTTILVFDTPLPSGEGPAAAPSRVAISRYDVGTFASAWKPEEQPDQWKRLTEVIEERAPQRIAIDVSDDFALGDGLSSSLRARLLRALPARYQGAVTTEHSLPIRWLETRIPEEMEVYPTICRIAHVIIAEGFATAVTPGETTTDDLEWWYRERIAGLTLDTWFHPTVSVQRAESEHSGSFASREGPVTIERGDLVHVDFGITYLRLNTDTQQHAYVLRAGEEDAPGGLKHALAVGNRLQDVLMGEFVAGRTGNQILAAALAKASEEGIEATIYTHPLGFHGHAAGPTIGLWDRQGGVPGMGDYPLHADTAFSIELNAAVPVPEWQGAKVRIMLEEDAFFDGEACRFIDGRQTELHLVR